MASQLQDDTPYFLGMAIEQALHPPICDRSGDVPFVVIVGVGRRKVPGHNNDMTGKHTQSVVIPFKDSILVVNSALRNGLLQLVEVDTSPIPYQVPPQAFYQSIGTEISETVEIGSSGSGPNVVGIRTPQIFRYTLEPEHLSHDSHCQAGLFSQLNLSSGRISRLAASFISPNLSTGRIHCLVAYERT